MKITENLGLQKPDPSETFDIEHSNTNMDIIDEFAVITKADLAKLLERYNSEVDWVIEKDENNSWTYKKWYSGDIEVNYTGYLTFTSGYSVVNVDLASKGIHILNSPKQPSIYISHRYIGDTRSVDVVHVPDSYITNTGSTNDSFVIYARLTGAAIAGAYYVDVSIKGRWK